jgi:adenosine deaminase
MDFDQVAALLPKTELHCHLDGSLSPDFISERAKARGIKCVPPAEVRSFMMDMKEQAQAASSGESAEQQQGSNWNYFDWMNQFLQTDDELTEATKLLVLELHRHNVRAAEIRFCPVLHTNEGLTLDDVMGAVIAGMEDALQTIAVFNQPTMMKAGVLVCALRSFPVSHSLEMVALAKKFAAKQGQCGVVGFDIAGDEGNYPLSLHIDALREAKKLGVKTTVHAGEWLVNTMPNLVLALEEGVERIGHGIAFRDDKQLRSAAAKTNVCIEICLTSNLRRVGSYSAHPVGLLLKEGINCCINCDNLFLSGDREHQPSPTSELVRSVREAGCTIEDVRRMLLCGAQASFAGGGDQNWLRAFENELEAALSTASL